MEQASERGANGALTRAGSDTRHLLRASVVVTGLGIVTRACGLLTNSVAAAIFGANRLMDAFRIVQFMPQLFSTWVEMPVRAAIVPLFTRRRQEEGEAAAWEAASNIINTLAVGLVLVSGVLFLSSGLVVRLASTGFRDEAVWSEMTRLTQIVVFSIVFSVLAVILGSLHNIYRQQHFPALGRLANGFAVLAALYFLGHRWGFTGYAVGLLAGAILTLLIQSTLLWQHRHHYRFILRPWAPEIREVVKVGLPLFIGLTGTRIDVFVDQNFASWLPGGSLTALLFAIVLSGVATDMVITVSSTVLLPHFAGLVAAKRFDELRRRLLQALGGYLLLLLPATVFLIVAARPIVDLFFLRGRFTPENAALTATLLPIVAVAAPVYAMGQVLAQTLISAGDTKTPMKVGFWRLGFKLIVTVSLIFPFGIVALAISSSASSYFRTALLWRRLPREMRPSGARFVSLASLLLVSALLGGGAGWGMLTLMPRLPTILGTPFIRLVVAAARILLAAGGTMLVHLSVAALLSPEARVVVARLFRKVS